MNGVHWLIYTPCSRTGIVNTQLYHQQQRTVTAYGSTNLSAILTPLITSFSSALRSSCSVSGCVKLRRNPPLTNPSSSPVPTEKLVTAVEGCANQLEGCWLPAETTDETEDWLSLFFNGSWCCWCRDSDLHQQKEKTGDAKQSLLSIHHF